MKMVKDQGQFQVGRYQVGTLMAGRMAAQLKELKLRHHTIYGDDDKYS